MSAPESKGSILLVAHSYGFPADPPPATLRPQGFAKYLARLGYEIVVLTTSAGETQPTGPGVEVVRAHDLMGSRLNWRRRHERGADAGSVARGKSPLLRVLVPDIATASWFPFALPAALRLARRRRFDCVLTTSPPQCVHLIGAALRRRGVPWVADLRDGWRFEPYSEWPTGIQRRFDGWLERRTLSRADQLTAVTDPISADLRERFGRPAVTITNGYDPEEPGEAGDARGLTDPNRHSLVYTGRFIAAGRTLEDFVRGLRLLVRESPEDAARLEIVVAGPLSGSERQELADPALSGLVRLVGVLDHETALRLQRQADSLLLLTADGRPSAATTKLYEYLNAARQILVIGDGSQAGQIAADAGAGTVVPAGDERRIAAALSDLVRGELPGFDRERVLQAREAYSFERLALLMSDVIDEVSRGAAPRGEPQSAEGAQTR